MDFEREKAAPDSVGDTTEEQLNSLNDKRIVTNDCLNDNVRLKLIKMSDVVPENVSWLWYPFIPYGKITIIQGDPGEGKTTLVLNIIAKLSKGLPLDGQKVGAEPINIIYQTAEDGLADTIRPRLDKAGADCQMIEVIDESEQSLSMADERIEEALRKTGARLLVLDPIQSYLGSGMDMNRANEAREMTKRLGILAHKYNCAIVLVGHMNKASGAKAAERGIGSIDFYAIARSVLLVGTVEGEAEKRAMVQIKNNLAKFGNPKAFEVDDDGFKWLGDYEITADELLMGILPKASKFEKAVSLLRELAEDNDFLPSNEIFDMAREESISKRTLENAKQSLGIQAKKIDGIWCWMLQKED